MKLAMSPAWIVCQGGTHKVVVVVSALGVHCIQTLIPGAQTSQIASVMQDIQDPMVGCVRLALWAATRAALAQRLVFSAHQTQCQRLAVITLLVARALKDSLAPTVNRVMPAELGFTKALQVMRYAISVQRERTRIQVDMVCVLLVHKMRVHLQAVILLLTVVAKGGM
jgi:hypothetical protein